MIGIYKITNPDNMIYIGQSVQIDKRIAKYIRIDKTVKNQTMLYRSLKKYTFAKHKLEILIECEQCDLNGWERYYQDYYTYTGHKLMNLRLTASNDKSGTLSDETKNKIGIANRGKLVGEKSLWYGKFGKEHPAFGNKQSDEVKMQKSIKFSGEGNPQYGLIGEKSPNYNTGRIIQQFDKEDNFIQEGNCNYFKKLNILNAHVYSCCNNKRKYAYGFIWKYKNKENN